MREVAEAAGVGIATWLRLHRGAAGYTREVGVLRIRQQLSQFRKPKHLKTDSSRRGRKLEVVLAPP